VSISISGQNERWAQLSAYQPPPASLSGQNGGWNSLGGTSASLGQSGNTAVAGGATAGLSDDTSFALIAFGGDWTSGSAAAGQTAGGSGAVSASSTQDAGSLGSQLLTDVQSLISALTGSAGSSTGTSATSGGTTDGTTAGTAATDSDSTVLQDLQTVTSDLGSIASLYGAPQPGTAGSPPGGPPQAGPPPDSNEISNTGTSASDGTGGTERWRRDYRDGLQQQFAVSAYTSSSASALDSSATSSLTAINV
jgi:hypothetical protein